MTIAALTVLAALAVVRPDSAAPFRLPVGARVTATSPDGGGWSLSGELDVPFVQAKGRLLTAARADGWRLEHTIALGRRGERVLMAFLRGGDELTIMVSRLGVARCSFSCGVSARKEGGL